jgi:ADP-ribose pyrophosphatase YjhB (NUDIX family)
MADARISETDLVRWSEALAGIARTGLGFTESLYERERYEEILKVAADIRVAAADGSPEAPAVLADWLDRVGSGVAGYVTPKVAVGAVVGNDAGELLLLQRGDSGVWLYPTGWADIGYSPAEVAVKEVLEETGIVAEPVRILAVMDGQRFGARGNPFYSIVFHLRAVGGELAAHPLEARAVGWFREDALPEPLAGAERWVRLAFDALADRVAGVYFDPPRSPIWRGDAEGGHDPAAGPPAAP